LKYGWIAATLLMGVGLCFAQSESPSLGDIAKKNQAAHGEKKTRKVITNDDLDGGASGNAAESIAAPGSKAAVTGKDSIKPDAAADSSLKPKEQQKAGGKSGTPSPQDEVERLKKELDSLKAQREGWKRSASGYEEKLAAETSEFRRTMYQDALANDRQNISICQRKIEGAESKLASAEEAASKAGAPPVRTGAPDNSHL